MQLPAPTMQRSCTVQEITALEEFRVQGILHVMLLYNHHVTTDARRIDQPRARSFYLFPS
jgi:hypothetical protein